MGGKLRTQPAIPWSHRVSPRYDPRVHGHDDPSRHAVMIYAVMLVVAVAVAGLLWQFYSTPEIPRIAAPPGAYKVRPPAEAANTPDQSEQVAVNAVEEAPGAAAAAAAVAEAGPPRLGAAPLFVANGPYVAQLAALQSEASVDQAWRRLSSRAPQLFEPARLDVERADLGPRGVYFRVRAGYFPDRANAARFCERIRQMGQDCIVAAR